MKLTAAYLRSLQRPAVVVALAVVGLLLLVRRRFMHFDAHTEAELARYPEASRARFRSLLERIRAKGWTPFVTSGVRTAAQQQYLYANRVHGATPPGPRNNHMNGRAMDLNFEKDGFTLTSGSSRAAWVASGIPAIMLDMDFRWGGQFAILDVVHADLGIA